MIGLTGLALAMAAFSPGLAGADVEPNDAVFQPEGPIVGEGDVSGTVAAGDTDDWYVLYVSGVHQLHLTSQLDSSCATLRLTDRDGKPLANDYTSSPGTTRFYVRAQYLASSFGCAGSASYNFRLEPASALVQGAGKLPLRTTVEPNDLISEASGPLGPNAWYFSKLETVNDQDWFALYTRGGRQRVDVEVVTYGGPCFAQEVELTDASGFMATKVLPHGGQPVTRLQHHVGRAQRLYVHVTSSGAEQCVGTTTVLQVGPDSAVMAPDEVREACGAAKRTSKRLTRRVAADRRALARAGKPAPRRLKRKLARDKRKLRAAKRSARVYCS